MTISKPMMKRILLTMACSTLCTSFAGCDGAYGSNTDIAEGDTTTSSPPVDALPAAAALPNVHEGCAHFPADLSRDLLPADIDPLARVPDPGDALNEKPEPEASDVAPSEAQVVAVEPPSDAQLDAERRYLEAAEALPKSGDDAADERARAELKQRLLGD